jgi:hypothetical protein
MMNRVELNRTRLKKELHALGYRNNVKAVPGGWSVVFLSLRDPLLFTQMVEENSTKVTRVNEVEFLFSCQLDREITEK